MKTLIHILTFLGCIGCLWAQDLSLSIKPSADTGYPGKITATFTNDGTKEIRLFKPLDGSVWRWHKPYYDFSLFDPQGKPLKIRGRCGLSGLYADTKWPDDYLVVLKPGEHWDVDLYLPFEIPENGDYQVTLSYIYDSTPDRKELDKPYPDNLWTGIVKSNLIKLAMEKP